jgi:succinylglutamate desuccinylase
MIAEEQIEEILMEANAYGIREEVIEAGKVIQHDNPKLTQLESIERAFKQLLNKTK